MSGRGEIMPMIYPPGCKEVAEGLPINILIPRLKVLGHKFQSMEQERGAYMEFTPLALHLTKDCFRLHKSPKVQLHVACCIAEMLRMYAPDCPFTDAERVKEIFLFLIKQLGGLKDTKTPNFKYYVNLLENLASVKSFHICSDLEDFQEICCSLFQLVFKTINDEHSLEVQNLMLEMLCPLIAEPISVPNELVSIILLNFVEPIKSQRFDAYQLARKLLLKCCDTLKPYIAEFIHRYLIVGKKDDKVFPADEVYELIYNLYHVRPRVLLPVLPQLEFQLKWVDEHERLKCVMLLARMFSEKDSQLALQDRQLWTTFLGRFNDKSVVIRTRCARYLIHFLINHPNLRPDLTKALERCHRDSEESIRHTVVKAILGAAKFDFSIISDSQDLMNYVKERTLDMQFPIRREALIGLAKIYKEFLCDPETPGRPYVPTRAKSAAKPINSKILHGYYITSLEDRLLVEQLFDTCLVPFQLSADVRMKKLYLLYATIDENATKSFNELQKSRANVRRAVTELTDVLNSHGRDKEILSRVAQLSKHLTDPGKAADFIEKFVADLIRDEQMLRLLETIVDPDISCAECADAVTQLLKKLGQPAATNFYFYTVKLLMDRISSVLIDKDAIGYLVRYVESCLQLDDELAKDIGIDITTAGEKGLQLLTVLAVYFPSHFISDQVLARLLTMLTSLEHTVSVHVLSILTFIGNYRPLETRFPDVTSQLVPICQRLALEGTPKQAKHAIRCLLSNLANHQPVFANILEASKGRLVTSSPHCRTSIVTLGHLAPLITDSFNKFQIRNIVSRNIVKELLLKNDSKGDTMPTKLDSWCDEDQLPENTRCKIESMKMMARWLLGLKDDTTSAKKTFRMLTAFIVHRGDLFDSGRISRAEMSWLRLSAGTSMLKICEQKGVGDQITVDQFYIVSYLLGDDVVQVREKFAAKLHRGLYRMPPRSLPIDFMGVYALAGTEEDSRIRDTIYRYMLVDMAKRRDYQRHHQKFCTEQMSDELPHVLVDYTLVYAVAILAHDPQFTSHTDTEQLLRIHRRLCFILQPPMNESDSYCPVFYKALMERTKNHCDALKPDDNVGNTKLWTACDLALSLINPTENSFADKDYPMQPTIPLMYFRAHPDPSFVNTRIYLPSKLQIVSRKENHPGTMGRLPKQSVIDPESDEEMKTTDPIVTQFATSKDPVGNRRSARLRSRTPISTIESDSENSSEVIAFSASDSTNSYSSHNSEDANVRARRSQPLKRRKSDGSPGESSTPVRKSTG